MSLKFDYHSWKVKVLKNNWKWLLHRFITGTLICVCLDKKLCLNRKLLKIIENIVITGTLMCVGCVIEIFVNNHFLNKHSSNSKRNKYHNGHSGCSRAFWLVNQLVRWNLVIFYLNSPTYKCYRPPMYAGFVHGANAISPVPAWVLTPTWPTLNAHLGTNLCIRLCVKYWNLDINTLLQNDYFPVLKHFVHRNPK